MKYNNFSKKNNREIDMRESEIAMRVNASRMAMEEIIKTRELYRRGTQNERSLYDNQILSRISHSPLPKEEKNWLQNYWDKIKPKMEL